MKKIVLMQSLHRILQKNFFLMHQAMFHQVENSNFAILLYSSLENKMCFDSSHKISLHEENSILHLPPPNLIRFDSSDKVPACGKQYSCNYCIQYFQRKFVLRHHAMFHQVEISNLAILLHSSLQMSQHEKNSTLAITAFAMSKQNLF